VNITEQTETTEQTRIYGFPGPPFPIRGTKLVQYFYVETQGRVKRYEIDEDEIRVKAQEAGKAADIQKCHSILPIRK
jgi:hypothetical protein